MLSTLPYKESKVWCLVRSEVGPHSHCGLHREAAIPTVKTRPRPASRPQPRSAPHSPHHAPHTPHSALRTPRSARPAVQPPDRALASGDFTGVISTRFPLLFRPQQTGPGEPDGPARQLGRCSATCTASGQRGAPSECMRSVRGHPAPPRLSTTRGKGAARQQSWAPGHRGAGSSATRATNGRTSIFHKR